MDLKKFKDEVIYLVSLMLGKNWRSYVKMHLSETDPYISFFPNIEPRVSRLNHVTRLCWNILFTYKEYGFNSTLQKIEEGFYSFYVFMSKEEFKLVLTERKKYLVYNKNVEN